MCCWGGMWGWGLRPWPSLALLTSPSRSHNIQAPKLKTVLTHSSSGEGSGRCRRFCPFRVRFADETLQDTALRYWERNCAGRQTGCGAPGLQKVPAWSPESRCCGPGSKGQPAKARNPLMLRRRLLQRVSGGPRRPSRVSEVLQKCLNMGGTREQQPQCREQWLPRLGHHCRTSCCQGFSGSAISAHLGTGGTHGLPTPVWPLPWLTGAEEGGKGT